MAILPGKNSRITLSTLHAGNNIREKTVIEWMPHCCERPFVALPPAVQVNVHYESRVNPQAKLSSDVLMKHDFVVSRRLYRVIID
jgi:hypothetical protein